MVLRFISLRKAIIRRCLVLFLLTAVIVNLWFGINPPGLFGDQGNPGGNLQYEQKISVSRDDPGKLIRPTPEFVLTHREDSCPYWCYRSPYNVTHTPQGALAGSNGPHPSPGPYFLTAVISVRVYTWKDLAKLGTRELIQWVQYLSYAGVEHVYLYDAYAFKNESQAAGLQEHVNSGYLTYTDWHHHAVPFSLGGTQAAAYNDCITRWGKLSAWQLGIDMDEYPFLLADRRPGFLARYLREFDTSSPDAVRVSELSMQNYLYLGKPLDDTKHPLLIDRIWRRTKKPANDLVKPIYRPAAVKSPDIHKSNLKYGIRKTLPVTELRMNHYWGARLQNWGEDTQEVLDMTVEDRSMEPIVANLYKCSSCRPP